MNKGTILLVEDEEDDIFLFQLVCKRTNIDNLVHATTDGQDAMDYLAGVGKYVDRKTYPLPCLVLLDLKLPGKSGLEILTWIRQQPSLKSMIVIIFTSSYYPKDIEKAYQLGVNSFIVKPSDPDSLLEIVRQLKGWWLTHNRYVPSYGKQSELVQ